ncbi:hypothetical protein DB32_006987 [Sandaracinus amylolyticus]|uniref:Tat (Twin-arginine translocation) pathway signal sequence domain protein n=2 Tax=Sandaracinus amylolyticus TaxID=927083 RepID=A0A0F6YM33_9BACT|nr:hypothetical protein DB32_006987 [Sandaracinus amylolyticus]
MSRRTLLAASLGAAQLALLERFSFLEPSRARACTTDEGPTRLLVLYLPGGVRFYPIFVPMSDDEITRTIPPPGSASGEPIFFTPSEMVTLDGDSGGFAPLRMGRNWNVADPGDRDGYRASPMGYSWIHYGLGPSTAVIHGIDQGTFAHSAAYVSAMCGVAGESYRAPAMLSTVANHLHARFASTRPIPCVAINSSGVPLAPGLPAQAAPAVVPSIQSLAQLFSSEADRHRRWRDCDARTPTDVATFDGTGTHGEIGLTGPDAWALERARRLGARARGATASTLEQIHGSYVAVSRTLANDVVSAVEAVTPVTHAVPDHLRAFGHFDFTFGLANGRIDMSASCEWILRLLKSNVTSAVYASLPERYYDFHNGASLYSAVAATRAQLDMIAQLMGELQATPSPDRAGRSLYDDTLVVVQSEFGRTWPRGPSQESADGWSFGDDHHSMTSVVLSGGGIAGNRQIGGYALPSTDGLPVEIAEEDGASAMRPPRSADLVATVCDAFGMRPGTDFFIPGGYGVIRGLCE